MPQTFPPVYTPILKKIQGFLAAAATEAWEMLGYPGSQAGGQPGQAGQAQPAFNHVHILYTPQLVFSTFILHLSPRNCKLRAMNPGDLLVSGVVLKYLTL